MILYWRRNNPNKSNQHTTPKLCSASFFVHCHPRDDWGPGWLIGNLGCIVSWRVVHYKKLVPFSKQYQHSHAVTELSCDNMYWICTRLQMVTCVARDTAWGTSWFCWMFSSSQQGEIPTSLPLGVPLIGISSCGCLPLSCPAISGRSHLRHSHGWHHHYISWGCTCPTLFVRYPQLPLGRNRGTFPYW